EGEACERVRRGAADRLHDVAAEGDRRRIRGQAEASGIGNVAVDGDVLVETQRAAGLRILDVEIRIAAREAVEVLVGAAVGNQGAGRAAEGAALLHVAAEGQRARAGEGEE